MKNTLRVLHVEDQERDAALVARHLKRAGYELISDRVDTPAAMRAALKTREWEVVLCDYSMPQFNALAALAVMKETSLDIPFIIISGTIGEAAAVEAMRAGANDYLMKDNLTRLGLVIEHELQEAENRRARRRAERALHETNQALQTFIQASPLAIVALDMERRVTLWNPAAERLFGWTEVEVIGRAPPTIPDQEKPNQMKLRGQILQQGLLLPDVQTRRLRKDGSLVDVSVSFAPLRDPQGKIVGTMGIIADITERKNAEEAKLKAAEQYRLLFEGNPLPMWVFDRQTLRFLAVNEAAIHHYGFSREEFLNMTIKEIRPSEAIGRLEQVLSHPVPGLERSGPWKHLKKDGTLIDVEISSSAMGFNGRSAELVLANDVTDQLRAQEGLRLKSEELVAMTQQLWQASKLATMGELAASIAHELNNPLATVGLRTEALLMQLPEDSDQRKPLEIIAQEVDRMANLVSNLLQFSRRGHRQISTVDPREELANSVEFVHYHLRTRKIEVVREFADPLPTIQADRQQLRQLFLNLLTNASDAMPRGGKLTVRATPDDANEAVVIEFADTGEGIAAENVEKIWEPFFTTKLEGKGTGLGMAICRRIVEEHGGNIEVQSQLGQGTTFRIVLPATGNGTSG